MPYESHEDEQFEALQIWWAKYRKIVIISVCTGALAFGMWKYGSIQKEAYREQAALSYEEFQKSLQRKDEEAATLQAKALTEKYSKTVYAEETALTMAKQATLKNEWGEAKRHIQWVIDKAGKPAVKELAKIELAKIYLFEKKPEEVFSLFLHSRNGPYEGIQEELKGDAYKMQGKMKEAQEAYKKAQGHYQTAEISHPLIEMKLHELSD
ncbi:MAG: tetratricopeptide repeat protein [Gammaproteobacteria bacterium]|nr:tetratricopeptide repeat protein [Gammaproteobacteria bacterium]